jgi:hypothetical protein
MRLLQYGGPLVLADWAHFQGGDVQKGLAEMAEQTNAMIDDLLWWTTESVSLCVRIKSLLRL